MRGDSRRVVIAGGGVIGLAAAVALLRRSGDVTVTVLERGRVGGGATARAGALDVPWCRHAPHRPLVEASWAWHAAEGDRAAAYRRPVPMTWYAGPGEEDGLRDAVAEPLSPEPPANGWAPDGVERFGGRAFVIDCAAWCRALVGEIGDSGRGRVVEHAAVAAIEDRGGVATVRCEDGRAYHAGHVVLALGPWLPGWSAGTRSWAEARGLRTKRVFGLDVRAAARLPHVTGWLSKDIFFHPTFRDGDYRLSFRRDVWDVDPDHPATCEGLELDAERRLLDGLLGPGAWSFERERVFADSYSPEFVPVVEGCRALGPRVTIATGTHGSGVRLAPGIADLVATRSLASLGIPEGSRAGR
ncbi:MAG TPA: FAD-dependent oxidoreductase [Longimicrobium sp.]|nr:FAD-dependent oxidoreductase [Longimicrobium sp.]